MTIYNHGCQHHIIYLKSETFIFLKFGHLNPWCALFQITNKIEVVVFEVEVMSRSVSRQATLFENLQIEATRFPRQ